MTTFEHEWAAPATEMPTLSRVSFRSLRAQNVSRKARWHGETDVWTGSDWSNAMAGECGEACNIVKKLRRHETHTGTAYNTPEVEALLPMLADEIADVDLRGPARREVRARPGGRGAREVQSRQRGAGVPRAAMTEPPRTGWETCCFCREFRGLHWIAGAWWCWRHRRFA